MAVGEFTTYARDYFHLSYPAGWTVRENRPIGLTEFWPHDALSVKPTLPYPPGIALITLAETGMALDPLLRTGLYFITRDLRAPSIERTGTQDGGLLTWTRLLIRGHVTLSSSGNGERRIDVVKRVALCRPGPGVLVLALFGTADDISPLEGAFDAVLASVEVDRGPRVRS